MKTTITILLAGAALGLASCTTTGVNSAMVPQQNVELLERQSEVTHNPNGLEEALQGRNAVDYSTGRRGFGPFGGGFYGGF